MRRKGDHERRSRSGKSRCSTGPSPADKGGGWSRPRGGVSDGRGGPAAGPSSRQRDRLCRGIFQKAPNSEVWGGEKSPREGEGPRPRFRWSFKVRERFVSRFQSTGGKGSGSPALSGDPARKQLSSWAPLSLSRWALGSSQQHKGRAVRNAQAREPPWMLGVVVRPPNGRSSRGPAAAPAVLVRMRHHFRPARLAVFLHPSTGRGFLVLYSSKSPGGVIRPRPAFSSS